ncbi:MAG: L-lactate permease, partial [Cohaesibacteraceae bacterium]
MAGALVGLVVFVGILQRTGSAGGLNAKELVADLAPYLMIVALILLTRLIGPLAEILRTATLDWRLYDHISGSFAPLYHPGTLLWGGLIIGALMTGRLSNLPGATWSALQRLVTVTLALLVMLTLSRLMVQSGMITALAEAAASTGPAWPILSPMVGVLGTFITGSATASNILFTDLQVQAAGALGLSTLIMVAAQGFGSAIGNTIAPHNIIAGAATVGLVGKEGSVLRLTARVCAVYTLLGGVGVMVALAL